MFIWDFVADSVGQILTALRQIMVLSATFSGREIWATVEMNGYNHSPVFCLLLDAL
jgi:hypothetical protein